jgi:ribosome biogenesis GTPase A
MEIQWFPGHMAKTRRLITENLKAVDIAVELLDARIPGSSRNLFLGDILGVKPVILILNKSDLADPDKSSLWLKYYKNQNIPCALVNSHDPKSMGNFKNVLKMMTAEKDKLMKDKGVLSRVPKVMVVGIPNSGKSSFINCLAGSASARTADKPGVTRGKQWIRVDGVIDLLDMPGVLQPKFENKEQARHLAFTGAIKDTITDPVEISIMLLEELAVAYPGMIAARYKIPLDECENGLEMLELCARSRGCLMSGGIPDINRMASVMLDEFRGGKIGRITLEVPEESK